jgi:Tol biopolymer transport system component
MTMPERKQQLASIETERPPDLWAEIQGRSSDVAPVRPLRPVSGHRPLVFDEHPNTGRLVAGLVAAAVFLAAFYLLTRVDKPAPIPETPVIVGPWGVQGLLYVSNTGGASNIWVSRPSGPPERLTRNRSASTTLSDAVWAPDGSEIAFASFTGVGERAVPTGLMVMRPDGSDVRQLSPGPGGDPIWSPDGSRIAFLSGSPRTPTALAVVNADGSGYQTLARRTWTNTREGGLALAAWSPDGTALAFVAGSSIAAGSAKTILVTRFDGAEPTVVTHLSGSGPIHDISWSPDGSHLAFSCLCGWALPRLYIVEPSAESHPKFVAPGWAPAWSPDGSRLAFVGRGTGGLHLSVVSTHAPKQVRSLGAERMSAVYPTIAWSPDGASVAFTAHHGTGVRIVVARSDLTQGQALPTDGDAWLDDVPGGYSP